MTDADLWDEPSPPAPEFGPIFTAAYDSEDGCCGDGLEAGQKIRGYAGTFIHAGLGCELLATGRSTLGQRGALCSSCWMVHGNGQKGCE
jgi:hypothetical protein